MRTASILLVSIALFSLAVLLLGRVRPSDPQCLDGPCATHDLLYIYGFLGTAVFGGLSVLAGVVAAARAFVARRR